MTTATKSLTIFGFHNARFFAGANPRGQQVWFATRRERDAALARLIESARAYGLNDPTDFPVIEKRLRGQDAFDWLTRLEERELLLANGIEMPQDQPDQMWGAAIPADEARS
jgi:hypothetical protein